MTGARDLLEGLHIQLLNQKAGVGLFKRNKGRRGEEGDRSGRK